MRLIVILFLFVFATAYCAFSQIINRDQSRYRDTARIIRNQHYLVDSSKNRLIINQHNIENTASPTNTAIPIIQNTNGDSIKLPKADARDWADFASAHDNLNSILQQDPYKNVQNYIDVDNDLVDLRAIEEKYLDRTAKVILQQLTMNITLLSQLLAKKLTDTVDLKPVKTVIENIKGLIDDYVRSVGAGIMRGDVPQVPLRIRVIGKDQVELTNA